VPLKSTADCRDLVKFCGLLRIYELYLILRFVRFF
jgi:hypothetical protein